MTSYLISNLSAGQVQTLQSAGLTCYLFDAGSNSYIVEATNLRPVQDLLRGKAETYTSAYEDIVGVNLEYFEVVEENLVTFEGTPVLVESNGQDLPQARFVRLIEDKLGHVVTGKIVLHMTPAGENPKRARTPFKDDFFHIHIWSAPHGKRVIVPPGRIWGKAVDCRNKAFGPTEVGVPLVDSDSEYVVGEIVANNLYVYHNLLSCYSDNEFDLFTLILEAAIPDLNLSPAMEQQRKKDRFRDARTKSRQQYIKTCGARIKEMVKSADKTFKSKRKLIRPLQNTLLKLMRLEAFGDEFPVTAGTLQARVKQFAAEYQNLVQVPRIKDVTARNNLVYLRTEKLYARHPRSGSTHELGEFLIIIDLRGGSAPVRWFNTMRRVDGARERMNAPNVYANGTPMLDEIQETMLELIARMELSVVAELAIQFVETTTDDLPFTHLHKWPLAAQQS
jgi:hypothetical protein